MGTLCGARSSLHKFTFGHWGLYKVYIKRLNRQLPDPAVRGAIPCAGARCSHIVAWSTMNLDAPDWLAFGAVRKDRPLPSGMVSCEEGLASQRGQLESSWNPSAFWIASCPQKLLRSTDRLDWSASGGIGRVPALLHQGWTGRPSTSYFRRGREGPAANRSQGYGLVGEDDAECRTQRVAHHPRQWEEDGGECLETEARSCRLRAQMAWRCRSTQAGRWQASGVAMVVVALVLCFDLSEGDRSGDILFFDGAQEPFNLTYPASPGFVYVTPRKTARGLAPWFEFQGSFSVQLWIRPQRVFLGTDIEQGVLGCLVRQTCGGCEQLRAGYGITITSDSVLHFYSTVGIVTSNIQLEVNINEWLHVTIWYDADLVEARLYTSPGDGRPPSLSGRSVASRYLSETPKSVNFDIHNDLILGKFQPIYDRESYYSGYIDELRFWSKVTFSASRLPARPRPAKLPRPPAALHHADTEYSL